MLKEPFINEQTDSEPQKSEQNPSDISHQKAIEHFNRNRKLFEHYAEGQQIRVEAAPTNLDTFAFNLETNTIYVNACFYQDLGLSEEKTTFATLHEIEHFLEKLHMLAEKDGDRKFARYLERIKASKAYGVMDNCIADIRENRAILSRAPEDFRNIEEKCYKDDLFKSTDFTEEPLHIQLPYAILREARVSDELCTVAPEVRAKLDELHGITSPDGSVRLMDIMTDPATPMSTRIELQNKYVWPIVEEFLKKDIENEKSKKNKGNQGDKGKVGGEEKTLDPNELFGEAYKKAAKKVPNAISIEDQKKILEDWKEIQKNNPSEQADKEYAEKIGVKAEELQKYRKIAKSLNEIINPETNVSVVQELYDVLKRIIAGRKKPIQAPLYPVEEGEDLVDPGTLVTEVKRGNLEPRVWETTEVKEIQQKKIGEVELTLVCDRSGSMSEGIGTKRIEQQRAAVLFMEVLKKFAKELEFQKNDLSIPLEMKSEIYSFQASREDLLPRKKMSKNIDEKECVDIGTLLDSTEGSTTDYVTLGEIRRRIDKKTERDIREGKLKKLVIVFTDGESDQPSKVHTEIYDLRTKGVIVIGIGITEGGMPALTTYAPKARLAPHAEDLPFVLAEVLKEHLMI